MRPGAGFAALRACFEGGGYAGCPSRTGSVSNLHPSDPHPEGTMLRFVRYLVVIIPVAQKLLRNKKVREVLRLKPLAAESRGRRGRR